MSTDGGACDEAMRVQDALRAMAHAGRELVPVPPFTAHLDRHSELHFLSGAIPDPGTTAFPSAAIDALLALFATRGRRLLIEVVEACWPGLEAALAPHGVVAARRMPGMLCAPGELVTAPVPADVTIVPAGPGGRDEDVLDRLRVTRAAFAELAVGPEPGTADVARVHEGRGGAVLARGRDGTPLGGAAWLAPALGISEIVGVGVRADARRRGIGGALTAAAAHGAFADGADLAFLTPGDDGAQSVYAAAGFRTGPGCVHFEGPPVA